MPGAQGAHPAGPLAHPTGDLAGQLPLRTLQTHQLDLLGHDPADLRLALAGVLAQREGDVVVQAHRPDQGTVLKQDAEELAHLIQIVLVQGREVAAVDPDRACFGLQ